MKSVETWSPSKFISRGNDLRATSDTVELDAGSWLVAQLVARAYAQALPLHARGRLIDLGCGKVPLYEGYAPHVATVTCVDWANAQAPNVHLDLEHDLTKPLPFANDAFETVILSDVLEHLPEPKQIWTEMARILSPGGKIILNVPFYYKLHAQPHDYYRYTEFALRRFADLAGLEVLHLVPVGGSLEVLTDVLAKHLVYIPVFGGLSAWSLQRLVYRFGRSRLGRKILLKTGEHFPLGYFMIVRKPAR